MTSDFFSWKKIGILLGLVFIAIYPVIHGDSYIMHIFILFFIWALVASNWNLLMGYAGIFSLGNIGYFAIGGYASGILCKTFGWSPWLCIVLGGLASMVLVTFFVGLPALRLSGIYIALLSLIFADSLPTILTQTRSITGGAMGLHDIPPLFEGITRMQSYYITFVLFLFILTIIYKVIHSSTGLAFVALRDSGDFATALKKHTPRAGTGFVLTVYTDGAPARYRAFMLAHAVIDALGGDSVRTRQSPHIFQPTYWEIFLCWLRL